jgi:hypothetical protein
MKYNGGLDVRIGDVVSIPIPSGSAIGRVIMLGDTHEHLDMDLHFLNWVKTEHVLRPDSVVIEWMGDNPFGHDDPTLAPVGNYMFTPIDEWTELKARANP